MMVANLIRALAAALTARADYEAEPHFRWLGAEAEEAERALAREVERALQDYVDARIAAYLATQGKEQP